jgi:outer membrane protein assembly factor BamD
MSSYKYAYLSVPSKQKERYLSFIDDYYNFIGEIPDSHYRKELDAIYAKAQKALGKRGVQADDDSSEKEFAKERAKLEKARAKAEKEAAKKVVK